MTNEELLKLQEEANRRIEEGRRREAKAWHDAKNFIAGSGEPLASSIVDEDIKGQEGPVKKLVTNKK